MTSSGWSWLSTWSRRMMILEYIGSLLQNEPNHFPLLTSRPGWVQSFFLWVTLLFFFGSTFVWGISTMKFFRTFRWINPSLLSPGVLAMKENEFLASHGFVSVTLSRLSNEDAVTLSQRSPMSGRLGFLALVGLVTLFFSPKVSNQLNGKTSWSACFFGRQKHMVKKLWTGWWRDLGTAKGPSPRFAISSTILPMIPSQAGLCQLCVFLKFLARKS